MLLKLGALFACGVFYTGLAAQDVSANPPAQSLAPFPQVSGLPGSYTLGPGDEISVQVLDLAEIPDHPFRIDAAGDLNLPLIGSIQAAGLTAARLRAAVAARLLPYLLHPSVTLAVVQFREQPFTVVGAVTSSGIKQIRGGKTLLDALSDAGGLRADAGAYLTITRPETSGPIPLQTARFDPDSHVYVAEVDIRSLLRAQNPAENVPLCAHDVVTVPAAAMVYVLGEVSHPGEYEVKQSRTLRVLDAMALAGGARPNASASRARVLRARPGTTDRTEIVLNLSQMLAGKSPEFLLIPQDILYIPTNKGKAISSRAIEALVGTGSSIAVFRGSR